MSRKSLYTLVHRFLNEEDGPSATEYAVMLALIIVVCIGTVTTFGVSVRDSVFGSVNTMFAGS